MRFLVDVWCTEQESDQPFKVTEGEFIFVAMDDDGKSRAVPNTS